VTCDLGTLGEDEDEDEAAWRGVATRVSGRPDGLVFHLRPEGNNASLQLCCSLVSPVRSIKREAVRRRIDRVKPSACSGLLIALRPAASFCAWPVAYCIIAFN
jgi:hypothetical protein